MSAFPHRTRRAWLAAALCAAAPAGAANLGGALALDSQLVDRGIAMTPQTTVVQASGFWLPAPGWALSLSAAAETRAPAPPLESSLALSRFWTLSDRWQLQAGLAHARYSFAHGAWRYTRTEATVGGTYLDMLTLALSASHLSGQGGLYPAADLVMRYPLPHHWFLAGGLGAARYPRFGVDQHGDIDYGYGHAGLVWNRGGWTLELDRFVTGANAPRPWDGPRVSPWVASASLAF